MDRVPRKWTGQADMDRITGRYVSEIFFQEEKMGKKLRIGLLGAGRIGNLHGTNIQNFVPDAEVVIVAHEREDGRVGKEHRHRPHIQGSRGCLLC